MPLHLPVQTLARGIIPYFLMMLLALCMSPDSLTAPMTATLLTVPTHVMLGCGVYPVSYIVICVLYLLTMVLFKLQGVLTAVSD